VNALLPAATETCSYPLAWWGRALCMFLALLLMCFGGFFIALLLQGHLPDAQQLPLSIVGVIALLLAVYPLLYAWRCRLILDGEGIELRGPFSARRLARSEIAGRRTLRSQYGTSVQIWPKARGARPLRFSPGAMNPDTRFDAWMRSLPDLDEQDREQTEAQVAADPEFGSSREERLEHLAAGRRTAGTLSAAGIGAAGWLYIYPRPYDLAVLVAALMPWAAILVAARSHGLYRLDSRRNDVRPNIAVPVLLPSIALALRAWQDIGVLDPSPAIAWVAALGVLFAFTAWRVGGGGPGGTLPAAVLALVLGACYASGVVLLGNALLDRAAGERYTVQVLSQHVTHGSRGGPTYHLRLAAWGPRNAPEDVRVGRALYQLAAARRVVCVHQRPGALQISWYLVRACPDL
jgi:hypothetical protein